MQHMPNIPLDKDLNVRAKRIWTMANSGCPIDDALLIIKNGTIQELGRYSELKRHCLGQIWDLGEVNIAPPLINAHTHLELSHLHGKTCLGQGFTKWIDSLIALPLQHTSAGALHDALSMLAGCTTIAVGDITGHSPETVIDFLAKNLPLSTIFVEVLGFKRQEIANEKLFDCIIREGNEQKNHLPLLALSGHSLYSTGAKRLSRAKSLTKSLGRPYAIHLAEHTGEVELLTTGRGEFASFLSSRLLPKGYSPPGIRPVAYADKLDLLDELTLAIHCVQVNSEEMDILANRQVKVCLCPRSNALIGVGQAPWEKMLDKGIMLCLGTDSLASNHDLSLWQEAKFLLENSSGNIPCSKLLEMMTCNPAQALGLKNAGQLQPGYPGLFSIIPQDLLTVFGHADHKSVQMVSGGGTN